MNTRNVFLMNLLLAVLWAALHADLSVTTFIVGFLFGLLLLSVAHRGYGATVVGVVGFMLFLIRAIIVSSIQVAGYVLAPTLRLDQGIIEIPLEAHSDLEIAILASSITLTPGTLSVDVGRSSTGQRVLYVHNLVMGDADAVRNSIKSDFERRILRVTRGGMTI
ncbi:MAG: Na+/H+ antiporter subunit E [Caldilineaceae bacterium]|jgi:multicomponent Na+:H+ antiporter subunit E|nr:Na+/H+ antiporter subunit E [Caldilineaceae bacterium]